MGEIVRDTEISGWNMSSENIKKDPAVKHYLVQVGRIEPLRGRQAAAEPAW